ncbi:MAG TPA: hypothetical protein VFD41_10190 [Actinomycetales bacterium]|nr:hypothetical protein [Actinomycetales bacterium]
MPVTAALLDPVVGASTVLVWTCAALLARAAQTDRADGPAPVANSRAAVRALVVIGLGLVVAAAQAAALVLHTSRDGTLATGAWPVLTAAFTGAALVAWRAVPPLRQMAGGRPLTDAGRRRDLHAAMGAAVAAGAVAVIVWLVGARMEPSAGASGPYLAPALAVGAFVLGTHSALRHRGALVPA